MQATPLIPAFSRVFLVLFLLAGAWPSHAAPEEIKDGGDLILSQGRFYTVAEPAMVEGSMVVRAGRIVYLGPAEGALAYRGTKTRILDLEGRSVIPGLIDAHSHLVGLGDAVEQVDLFGFRSLDELVAQVKTAAANRPVGTWILGRGWDQNLWPGMEFPDHSSLSKAVPDHPVWLTRVDGHAAFLNAAAMKSLGLKDDVTDPEGGRFLRRADGTLLGVLVDRATEVGASIPSPPASVRRARLARAGQIAASLGLTTVTDMGVDAAMVADYQAVTEAGQLPVRAALFLTDEAELLETWFERGPLLDEDRDRLMVRGIKLYADGALGSRGAALIESYSDDPGNLGLLTVRGDHVREVARRALDRGFQVGIHAIGDRGALVALDGLEAAFGGSRPEARFRIEHAQVMRLADIQRTASLGLIFSMQPTHATSDMGWAGDRVGAQRLVGAYAWRKALDAGGRLAFGSDFPVELPDPRLGLYAAETRTDLEGAPSGGWLPGERMSRQEALRGFTLDAAYSLFLDHEVGSLEVGKRADLVVFDGDFGAVEARELSQLPIAWTLVDGEIVFAAEGAR